MRQVSVRDFQLRAKEYLQELPIELVSHGKILGVIVSSGNENVEDILKVVKENRKLLFSVVDYIETAKARLKTVNKVSTSVDDISGVTKGFHRCEGFKCMNVGVLYKGKGRSDEGEVVRELYLCDIHKTDAEKAGEDLVEV